MPDGLAKIILKINCLAVDPDCQVTTVTVPHPFVRRLRISYYKDGRRPVSFRFRIEHMNVIGLLCDAPFLFNATHARDERVFVPPTPNWRGTAKLNIYS